jgi:hypothetical protein
MLSTNSRYSKLPGFSLQLHTLQCVVLQVEELVLACSNVLCYYCVLTSTQFNVA